ncbi:helix-turn-helix domain-containing protein [Alkalihalobacillus sp. BA299]|uniref:helix-turn-helix domain-containing protein n=1 Tax=Alkalihalobacillus sp. BA299 TaxID=2815938 RepID=UPI001ADD56F9|nr:helix-turn-helix domain-containing protein [Alkalihalobacillus sp. BA299]
MKRKNWTEEEIYFLLENVGTIKLTTIAQKLNRSEHSILCKMKRLGISNTKEQTGLLTTCELEDLLQVDRSTIRRWITEHGLKSIKKTTRSKKKFHLINTSDFWSWAYQNREKVDFSKIEYQSIVPEPDWVMDERKNVKKINYKQWSTIEEIKLQNLISKGISMHEIAKKLGRSLTSVKRKYDRLKLRQII